MNPIPRKKTRTIAVYRHSGAAVILKTTDTLAGGDLLPGLQLPVASIFA